MPQATFSVRMNDKLKREFDTLCADFGMNATTAINVFAKAVVCERKIPFEIVASEPVVSLKDGRKAFWELREVAKQNGLQDMSLEEINAEIQAVWSEAELQKLENGRSKEIVFDEECPEITPEKALKFRSVNPPRDGWHKR